MISAVAAGRLLKLKVKDLTGSQVYFSGVLVI